MNATAPALIDVARQRQQDERIEDLHRQLTDLARELKGDQREIDAWKVAIAFRSLRRPEVAERLDAERLKAARGNG